MKFKLLLIFFFCLYCLYILNFFKLIYNFGLVIYLFINTTKTIYTSDPNLFLGILYIVQLIVVDKLLDIINLSAINIDQIVNLIDQKINFIEYYFYIYKTYSEIFISTIC